MRPNVLLLFLVTIEPCMFNILTRTNLSSQLGEDVSTYYALDIAGMNLVMAYFTHLSTNREGADPWGAHASVQTEQKLWSSGGSDLRSFYHSHLLDGDPLRNKSQDHSLDSDSSGNLALKGFRQDVRLYEIVIIGRSNAREGVRVGQNAARG